MLVALLPSSIEADSNKSWPSILDGPSANVPSDFAFLGLGSQHEHAFWLGLEVSIEAQGFVSCLSSPCLFRLSLITTWLKAMLAFV